MTMILKKSKLIILGILFFIGIMHSEPEAGHYMVAGCIKVSVDSAQSQLHISLQGTEEHKKKLITSFTNLSSFWFRELLKQDVKGWNAQFKNFVEQKPAVERYPFVLFLVGFFDYQLQQKKSLYNREQQSKIQECLKILKSLVSNMKNTIILQSTSPKVNK